MSGCDQSHERCFHNAAAIFAIPLPQLVLVPARSARRAVPVRIVLRRAVPRKIPAREAGLAVRLGVLSGLVAVLTVRTDQAVVCVCAALFWEVRSLRTVNAVR